MGDINSFTREEPSEQTCSMLSCYLAALQLCRLLRIPRQGHVIEQSSIDGMSAWSSTKCIVTWLSIGFLRLAKPFINAALPLLRALGRRKERGVIYRDGEKWPSKRRGCFREPESGLCAFTASRKIVIVVSIVMEKNYDLTVCLKWFAKILMRPRTAI